MVEAVLAICSKARLLNRERIASLIVTVAWLEFECLGSRRLLLPKGTRNLALAAII